MSANCVIIGKVKRTDRFRYINNISCAEGDGDRRLKCYRFAPQSGGQFEPGLIQAKIRLKTEI